MELVLILFILKLNHSDSISASIEQIYTCALYVKHIKRLGRTACWSHSNDIVKTSGSLGFPENAWTRWTPASRKYYCVLWVIIICYLAGKYSVKWFMPKSVISMLEFPIFQPAAILVFDRRDKVCERWPMFDFWLIIKCVGVVIWSLFLGLNKWHFT